MAKLNISRLFETSVYLTTQAGQELQPMLEYLSNFTSEVVRNLRAGLTFGDNFLSETKVVSVLSGVNAVILPSKTFPVTQIQISKVYDGQFFIVTGFGWTFDINGNLIVNITFGGSPPADRSIQVGLLIFY